MSTKRTQKSYDNEFKAQAVKLAQEIGGHKAAKELGVPDGTIYCWIKGAVALSSAAVLFSKKQKPGFEKSGFWCKISLCY